MTARLLPLSIGVAMGGLALGYAMGGLWTGMLLVLALGFIWLLGQRYGWTWVASVTFFLFVGAAVVGLWLDLAAVWMLAGVVAALSAWDLDHFVRRQRSVGWVEAARELERRHLQRLLMVAGLGLLLAAVALGIQLRLGFGAAFLLGLLAVVALSRAVGFLRISDQ